MVKHTVTAGWIKEKAFQGIIDGHRLIVDSESAESSLGASPKKLMLLALAGCTGVDIIIILKKMKIKLKDFKVTVEGELTEEFPRYYHTMHTIYEFTGKDLPLDNLKKAVELSEEKYCGVRAVYVKAIKLTSEIIVTGI